MPSELTTPTKPSKRKKFEHVSTPTKAAIRGAVSFLEAHNIPYSKPEVFKHFEVPRASGYRILTQDSSRTRHNNPLHPETRGSNPILDKDEIQQINDMFEEGIEKGEGDAQWLAPESLRFEMGYDVDKKRMFQRAIKEETEYRRCKACQKS